MYRPQVKEAIIFILIFTIVVVASGADLIDDLSHGADTGHIVKEAIIVFFSFLAIVWFLIELLKQKREIKSLQLALKTATKPKTVPDEYVLETRKQLRDVITQQFSDWNLTSSEIEIGWLLLKGLSLKEIAIIRNTQEKTVRQQASAIYKKSAIEGRHAFSAWFIEDIL
ncbi:MAG: DNA-binding response regulator [Proteobacteria bacterium]|nr:DNA-binding response regulator [Pseudomonadota bacterium]NOG59446.1 DNA-binding response regulator [Pseudomonadota bacterium]